MKKILLFGTFLCCIFWAHAQNAMTRTVAELMEIIENHPPHSGHPGRLFTPEENKMVQDYLQAMNGFNNSLTGFLHYDTEDITPAMVYCHDAGFNSFNKFSADNPGLLELINYSGNSSQENAGAIDNNNPSFAYVSTLNGNLYKIEVETGIYTFIGFMGSDAMGGMAFNPLTGVLYGISYNKLYSINTTTAELTEVGNHGGSSYSFEALAIDGNGVGYTYNTVTDMFYSIDISNGNLTQIGPLGFNAEFGQAMDWDPVTGNVYMAGFYFDWWRSEWRIVDVTTGEATFLATINDAMPHMSQISWISMIGDAPDPCFMYEFPFLETFEDNSETRDCWTQEQTLGEAYWTFAEGSNGGNVTQAYEGNLNARYVSSTTATSTKLISPVMDITSLNNPELQFFYSQQESEGNQNQLKIYYRTSVESDWEIIENYLFNVDDWTESILSLPEKSATFQIAFEGFNNNGFANTIDAVSVREATLPPPTNCFLEYDITDGPIWDRPENATEVSTVGVNVNYHIYGPFSVDVAGEYTLNSVQNGWDGMVFLYENSFNPNTPLNNYLDGNDDFEGVGTSQIIANLDINKNYYFITTGLKSTEYGSFETTISGPGTVYCNDSGDLSYYCGTSMEGSLENGIGDLTMAIVASDIYVPAGTVQSVSRVTAKFYGNIGYGILGFFEDNGGVPGTRIGVFTSVLPSSQTLIGNEFEMNVYEVVLDLPSEFVLSGGNEGKKYWIGFMTTPGTEGGGNYIESTDEIHNETLAYVTIDYGQSWEENDLGIDIAFSIEGTCEDFEIIDDGRCDLTYYGPTNNGLGDMSFYTVSNDFEIAADEFQNVDKIFIKTFSNIGNAYVSFYADNNGQPGEQIGATSFITPTSQNLIGASSGFNLYRIELDLPQVLTFEGGDEGAIYWVGLKATIGTEGSTIYLESSHSINNALAYLSSDNGATWFENPVGLDCAFSLEGPCEEIIEPTDGYCEPESNCDNDNYISRVQLQEIDNITACSAAGYGNYTNQLANLTAGQTYPIAVTVGAGSEFATTMVWIDYNSDFIFEETEFYFIGSTPGTTQTAEISIPENTPIGTYRMRVRMGTFNPEDYDLATLACEDFENGETEDYTILVNHNVVPEGCDQIYGNEESVAIGIFESDENSYVVGNDVKVLANTSIQLEKIKFQVMTLGDWPTTFNLAIYENENGLLGDMVGNAYTEMEPTSMVNSGTFGGSGMPTFYVELSLPEPVVLEGSATEDVHYWIVISAQPTIIGANIYWASSIHFESSGSLSSILSSDGGNSWEVFELEDGRKAEGHMEITAECLEMGVDDLSDFDFAYYPNPVKDVLHLSSEIKINTLEVYNLAGQLVVKNNLINVNVIDLNTLISGVYIVKVQLENGQIETFKINKE